MGPVPSHLKGDKGKLRKLITLLAVGVVLLAVAWLAVQTIMARQITALAEAGTGFGVGSIRQLHDPRRIGVHLTDPRLDLPAARIALPEAVLSLVPLSPTTVRLDLPQVATLDLGSGPHQLGLSATEARIRLQPLSGLAPGMARITAGPMTLDGQPVASALTLSADLAARDGIWPGNAQTAYDLNWSLSGFDPSVLPRLPGLAQLVHLKGPIALEGAGRVWLDKTPTLNALETPPTPLPVGVRIDSMNLRINQITLRVMGMIGSDETGRANGALALYTSDPDALLQTAADAGIIAPMVLRLGQGVIRKVSALKIDPGQTGMVFPEPDKGELRLPLTFTDGQMRLGPIPLGPAPQLRPQVD